MNDKGIVYLLFVPISKYRLLTVLVATVLLVALIALLLTQCGGPSIPKQVEWSEWMDRLPDYATDENYLIEEQVLYRSRKLETTTSTEQSSIGSFVNKYKNVLLIAIAAVFVIVLLITAVSGNNAAKS